MAQGQPRSGGSCEGVATVGTRARGHRIRNLVQVSAGFPWPPLNLNTAAPASAPSPVVSLPTEDSGREADDLGPPPPGQPGLCPSVLGLPSPNPLEPLPRWPSWWKPVPPILLHPGGGWSTLQPFDPCVLSAPQNFRGQVARRG